jgi:hypothetical protein
MMEKQDKMRLMKPRSYRMVLAKGFILYLENFRRLFKASWITAIVFALCNGALGTLTAIQLPELTTTLMQQTANDLPFTPELSRFYLTTAGLIFVLTLLSIAAQSLASGTILNKFKEHKETGAISVPTSWLKPSFALTGRTVKGVFMTLGVILVPVLLVVLLVVGLEKLMPETAASHATTFGATCTVLVGCILLLSLPLMYVLMKYILEAPCRFWKMLRSSYVKGLRHWGLIFPVFFISCLITGLIVLVVTLPSQILHLANQQAYMGQLIGDELGMPSYITLLTFFTVTACSLLAFYVSQLSMTHFYYLYGSIEARTQEEQDTEN